MDPANGLTSAEARHRVETSGSNAIADVSRHPLRLALEKLWAPIPWMLEAAILLALTLHDFSEAAVIAVLLLFNAALGLFQETRSQSTLDALKSRLALNATVKRDGRWRAIPATGLVIGDVVNVTLGTVIPADVRLLSGSILLDESMLTGESLPLEAASGAPARRRSRARSCGAARRSLS